MAIGDFYNFLNKYSQYYYDPFICNIDELGDLFCEFQSDETFSLWLEEAANYGLNYQGHRVSANTPFVDFHCKTYAVSSGLPAYAVALNEYFYKEYQYPEDAYRPSEKRRITELETYLSQLCHCGRTTISSWKSGTRIPDKYKWWVLAITEFKLSYFHIQPFLNMIGSSVDMTKTDDMILFYALCADKSAHDVFVLLQQHGCTETKKLFTYCSDEGCEEVAK